MPVVFISDGMRNKVIECINSDSSFIICNR